MGDLSPHVVIVPEHLPFFAAAVALKAIGVVVGSPSGGDAGAEESKGAGGGEGETGSTSSASELGAAITAQIRSRHASATLPGDAVVIDEAGKVVENADELVAGAAYILRPAAARVVTFAYNDIRHSVALPFEGQEGGMKELSDVEPALRKAFRWPERGSATEAPDVLVFSVGDPPSPLTSLDALSGGETVRVRPGWHRRVIVWCNGSKTGYMSIDAAWGVLRTIQALKQHAGLAPDDDILVSVKDGDSEIPLSQETMSSIADDSELTVTPLTDAKNVADPGIAVPPAGGLGPAGADNLMGRVSPEKRALAKEVLDYGIFTEDQVAAGIEGVSSVEEFVDLWAGRDLPADGDAAGPAANEGKTDLDLAEEAIKSGDEVMDPFLDEPLPAIDMSDQSAVFKRYLRPEKHALAAEVVSTIQCQPIQAVNAVMRASSVEASVDWILEHTDLSEAVPKPVSAV